MKNSRLFQILYLLVEKRSLTARELAERFEVSERTIYRDIDALSAAGIPVYTQQGQGGGIRLMDQFVLDRALLSPEEQDEILLALQAVLSFQSGETGETLSRLSALFRREGGNWLEVDFAGWGGGTREQATFSIVKRAILTRHVLSFTYYSAAGEQTRRSAEPVRLAFKEGCWYLQGWCRLRRGWRTFRLTRIEDAALEPDSFLPRSSPPELDPPTPSACPTVALYLRFQPEAAWRVRDFFHPRQVKTEASGCLLVEDTLPGDNWLLSFLLSFGAQVEVLAPASWRELVQREAKKAAAQYETGQTLSGFPGYPMDREEPKLPQHKEDSPMEERKFCQCCMMPLDRPEDQGTEADGSLSPDYCRYCYQDGAFTAPDATMEDMIAFNLKFNAENGFPLGPQEEAERNMRSWFPTLKRWRSQ